MVLVGSPYMYFSIINCKQSLQLGWCLCMRFEGNFVNEACSVCTWASLYPGNQVTVGDMVCSVKWIHFIIFVTHAHHYREFKWFKAGLTALWSQWILPVGVPCQFHLHLQCLEWTAEPINGGQRTCMVQSHLGLEGTLNEGLIEVIKIFHSKVQPLKGSASESSCTLRVTNMRWQPL